MSRIAASPRKPRRQGNAGLLSAIRAGTSLKDSNTRKVEPKKSNKRNMLLDNIRKGIKLKKSQPIPEKKEKDAATNLNNAMLLALNVIRDDVHGDSDSDSDWS